MAHCGYEPTAANRGTRQSADRPWVASKGRPDQRSDGRREIDLSKQGGRRNISLAEQVQKKLSEISRDEAVAAQQKASTEPRRASSARG